MGRTVSAVSVSVEEVDVAAAVARVIVLKRRPPVPHDVSIAPVVVQYVILKCKQ
jgi:hypothetical protein